ncbi:hypothetical protein N7G274_004901 [Stereocaulon virgatum]|uniref:General stress protein FMN-binding split barrel domain-containing protein n=1 Tax=Stereocaulon virgatum TaxID=373712 RepID=A0ABR4ACH9_9LECA
MRLLLPTPKPCARSITPPSIASSLRLFSVLITSHCRLHRPSTILTSSSGTTPLTRSVFTTSTYKMSQKQFSNTEVPGDKPADPYKASNLTEPELKEKVQDLVKFMESCKFGMMTTRIESTGLLTSRCMALAAKESGGVDLLFHTNTESGKTNDLKNDPKINIAFLNSTGEWASVSGEAEIITDREVVRKYYSQSLKAWLGDLEDGKHDGGPEDPRIGVIKVKAVTATYAIATGTALGRGAEILKGTITGSAPKVNKLREISEAELQQWRQQNS